MRRCIFVAVIFGIMLRVAVGENPAAVTDAIPQPAAANSEGADYFESKVRPLFAARCQKCHGAEKQESGLRLDRRETFFHGADDGAVVVPGDADKSLLIQAVAQIGDIKMPPSSKLSDEEIATLTKWVQIGAPWPKDKPAANAVSATMQQPSQHWAFQPVRLPALPDVQEQDWVKSPVDAFILAKLEAAGLQHSAAADRRTLIRRATFDLLGLPPTPEEVEAFVADSTPYAYAKLIDRLIESPHYGERWARYWLDVARYADTKGYVFKEDRNYPFAYTYRDWVVQALNADLPYDQFLLKQIAADLLPRNDDRSLAALGFLTLGRRFLNHRPDIIDDRLDVIFRGTQGLTVTCARCHDHKFDPIPTDDYYSLYGVLDCSVDKTIPLSPPTKEYLDGLKEREQLLADFVAAKRETVSNSLRAQTREYLLAASRLLGEAKSTPAGNGKSKEKLIAIEVIHWRDYLEAQHKKSPQIWEPLFAAASNYEKFSTWLNEQTAGQTEDQASNRANANAKSINPILLKKLAASKPTTLEELVGCYAEVLADVEHQWKQSRLLSAVRYTMPPPILSDANAEALRQVLYADNSPTNVSQDGLNDLLRNEDKSELQRRKDAVEKWKSSSAAPPQALVLNDVDTKKQPHVFARKPQLSWKDCAASVFGITFRRCTAAISRRERPIRIGAPDRCARESVDGAGDGESNLDASLRNAAGCDAKRFRYPQRTADASRIAGLFSSAICGQRLVA